VRYVDSRDEILNVFRQTVEWVISERMENECRIECVNEHEIQGVSNLLTCTYLNKIINIALYPILI